MLIKRVPEVDPLSGSRYGTEMKVVAFIDPPQGKVIEKILRRHRRAAMVGGLWHTPAPRSGWQIVRRLKTRSNFCP